MEVKKVRIHQDHGLHMRVAANVAQITEKYKSKIYLCRKCKFANSRSIIEMVILAATKDSEVAIIAEGPDEKEAIKNISDYFENGAGI